MSQVPVTVIILAAQRTGVVNPLAERAGVSHKCLVPICGRPLVEYVMETITTLPAIKAIRVVLEPEGQQDVDKVLEPFRARGIAVDLIDSDPNIVESVIAASKGEEGPFIITTADNVLLTQAGFEQMRDALGKTDAALGLAAREQVLSAHPEGQRRFYQLRDAGYANCNIYALANRKAFAAVETFREGGQFMNNPGRLVRAFGLFNILLMKLKLVSIKGAMRRISRRFGVEIEAVVFADGGLAIDVDNERTFSICEQLLPIRRPTDIRA